LNVYKNYKSKKRIRKRLARWGKKEFSSRVPTTPTTHPSLLFSRHLLLRPPQQLPHLPRLDLPMPHLLHQSCGLGPPQQPLHVPQPRPEADAADAASAAVALRALDELVGVFRALAVEGAPLSRASTPVLELGLGGLEGRVEGGKVEVEVRRGSEGEEEKDRIVSFEDDLLLPISVSFQTRKPTHMSQGVTPVPAHSRHLAGSTEAAVGGASPSAPAAEARDGTASAATSDERAPAAASSVAERREVEGAAAAAVAAFSVVIEGVAVACCHRRVGRVSVREKEGEREREIKKERWALLAAAAASNEIKVESN